MSGPEAHWRASLDSGRFLIQRSVNGGEAVFPPRIAAPGSGEALEWVEACGLGTVYSVTIIGRRPPEPDYNVVLVDLDEGVRMMSRVEGVEPGAVRIGMRVAARIIREDDKPLLVFDPLETQHGG
ncbi:MAG: hypothetical protein JWP15_1703 [Alphaproteobacteria bacterium]|nr:hypothetical protein [Alphaproteobacteria bacterium]